MAINTGINSYILEQLSLLDSNGITAEQLIEELLLKLSTEYGLSSTEELRQIVTNMVLAYQNKAITSEDFITIFNSTANSSSNTIDSDSSSSYSGGGGGTSKKKKKEETAASGIVTDVDTDIVITISTQLAEIEATLAEADIEVPSKVSSYDAGIAGAVTSAKSSINSVFNSIKEAMQEVLQTATALDDPNATDIELVNFQGETFAKISEIAYDVQKNSVARQVTEEFFKNGGCTIDGNFAILKVNGKEYKYDMKKHEFYVEGEKAFEAYFYVPSRATDYSKLNTYTCFIQNDERSKRMMDSSMTNSVVARISKPNARLCDKYNETADLTKFMNAVAKTDKTNCKNIIAGDSAYGSHALQITAENPEVYDTVYCINFAATLRKNEDGIGNCGGKRQQFESLDTFKKLDGKDIYFISVAGDANLEHCYDGITDYAPVSGSVPDKYRSSYLYTGIELLCEQCPNANVHLVYNENGASTAYKNNLVPLFKELQTKYNKFHYEPEAWSDFANKDYVTHSQGVDLVNDVAKASVTNYNNYTASNRNDTVVNA